MESWSFKNNAVEMWNMICIFFLMKNVTAVSMIEKKKVIYPTQVEM